LAAAPAGYGAMNMLTFSKIERYLHHYAGRFQSRDFEHDELVNEAWLRTYPLNNPRFASKGILRAMLHYIRDQRRQRTYGNRNCRLSSIGDYEFSISRPILLDIRDEIAYCLKDLRVDKKELLYQRYYQGFTVAEIAQIKGVKTRNIESKITKIKSKLKNDRNKLVKTSKDARQLYL